MLWGLRRKLLRRVAFWVTVWDTSRVKSLKQFKIYERKRASGNNGYLVDLGEVVVNGPSKALLFSPTRRHFKSSALNNRQHQNL